MRTNIDEVLNQVLKDYKAIALEALTDAAHKGQKDIIDEAHKYLQQYYRNFDPDIYRRTYSLKNAIVPIFQDNSTADKISIRIGVEYDDSKLQGCYKSNSWYHKTGTHWISRNDENWDWDSQNNGKVEASWILDNFLKGEHGGAQRDFNGTYTLMPYYFNNTLKKNMTKYIQDSLITTIMNKL